MMRSPNISHDVFDQNRLLRPFPKIYYVHPLLIGPSPNWRALFERCRELGFDHVASAPLFAPGPAGDVFLAGDIEASHPVLQASGTADRVIGDLAGACAASGLRFLLDVVIDRADRNGRLAASHSDMFGPSEAAARLPDPRTRRPPIEAAYVWLDQLDMAQRLADFWTDRLGRLLDVGVGGFRWLSPQCLPSALWQSIHRDLRRTTPDLVSLAWTPGATWSQIEGLAGAGFDGVFSSLAWWDRRSPWFVTENDSLQQAAPVIACPEAPFGPRLASRLEPEEDVSIAYRQALRLAAATGSGWLLPMGFEFAAREPMDGRRSSPDELAPCRSDLDLCADIRGANSLIDRVAALRMSGELRTLTSPAAPVTALLRADTPDSRQARNAMVVLINPDLSQWRAPGIDLDPAVPAAGAPFADPSVLDQNSEPDATLAPGEVRLVTMRRAVEVRQRPHDQQRLQAALRAPRIVIEAIAPMVEGGRFAAKRVSGERVAVEADIYADGHDVIVADLVWRAADERAWRRVPMRPLDNDRWRGEFTPGRIGRHVFSMEAWSDEYRTLCRDIEAKRAAKADLGREIEEGSRLLADALARAEGDVKGLLARQIARITADPDAAAGIVLAQDTRDAMAELAERRFCVRHEPGIRLDVERPQAAFGAWYELFPRSASRSPGRHGTFDDVIARLPEIRAMGFDVLYLTPIHPIGKTNRKGRNNSLAADPGDPGSPYAIGSEEGGHDAIHPALGTLQDFRRLVKAAADSGLEIALDFAIQCSPDHPWLKQHPGWFRWRQDGSIRFAENPPKKYEDIVNVDFYAEASRPDLWTALRDVVLFWIEQGVKIFRVDNPHTKPLAFWEWLIADLRARHPDTIFLSEAFTHPKMMYRLAKIGFSQSYTYFTWRNTKRELTDYLVELTTVPVKEHFRPHFFVNTPDINPLFLQNSGRPGFLIRAALAATLSGLWGMYSGFELCEAAPLPGREEYLDAEKYEIRQRDYRAPGNIVAEITRLNRIRRTNPALHSHLGLTFYQAYNDQVLLYGKALSPRHDMILTAVSLDPHHAQEAVLELPLWEWGLPDDGSVSVEDLMRDRFFIWTGKLQRVRLDPADLPFAIWRIATLPGYRR
jgi:starch synthase (maltosyl-transferring)